MGWPWSGLGAVLRRSESVLGRTSCALGLGALLGHLGQLGQVAQRGSRMMMMTTDDDGDDDVRRHLEKINP